MKKIAVLTSGGDAPGMNAAIRAVARTAHENDLLCAGVMAGYKGLMAGDFMPLGPRSVGMVLGRGGTLLKSSRSKEFTTYEGRQKAYQQLKENEIDALIAIGGNGTLTGAHLFGKEFAFPVIGIPGSIDNDLFGTDYSLGFQTAVQTAVEAIDKIRDTATSHDRIFFVEVMGRDSGWIALHTALASGAIAVALPEVSFNREKLLKTVLKNGRLGKLSSIVVVAEGCKEGSAGSLAGWMQHMHPEYDIRVTVLGHLQRGGPPAAPDRILASQLGHAAVKALLAGSTDVMVGQINNHMALTPLIDVVEKDNRIDTHLLELVEGLSN
ncbi:MAG TPA: ATP-dependent 6-phosphofructokinase [Luteibaculaceae bacterium]|nr:ATP-dependent 6-phosphofructokinase [Luteibaculaceae bacterium]